MEVKEDTEHVKYEEVLEEDDNFTQNDLVCFRYNNKCFLFRGHSYLA